MTGDWGERPESGGAPGVVGKFESASYRERLWRAHIASRRGMKPFLQARRDVFEHFAGPRYGTERRRGRKLLNKVNQGLLIFSRLLAARNPAVRVRSELPEGRFVASLFTLVMTKAVGDLGLQRTMQEMVMDALALYGMAKVCEVDSPMILDHGGESVPLSKLSVSRVSPDRATWDMAARSLDARQFVGDLADVDLDALKEDKRYKNTDGLTGERDSERDGSGWQDSAESLSRDTDIHSEGLYDRARVWNFHIPRENIVVTLSEDGGTTLRVSDFEGPDGGPYDFLGFVEMPDNPMPVGPATHWLEPALLIETLADKMGRQAERQKQNPVGMAENKADMRTAQEARDGEWIALDAPGQIQTISTGGVDQLNFGYLHWLIGSLNVQMGNIDLLSGGSAQSDTATQDQMLMRQANLVVDDMRQTTVASARRIVEKVAYYKYHNLLDESSVALGSPDLGVEIERRFGADARGVDWADLGLDIQPFSMLPKTPAAELAEIREFLLEVLAPLAPLAQEQGVTIPLESLVAIWADRTGVPDMNLLLKSAPELQAMREEGVLEMPKRSRREYIRRSESGKRGGDESQNILLNIAQSPDGRGRGRGADGREGA